MASVKTVAKKLVDWQHGMKVLQLVKPDIKKNVQDVLTRNGELHRQLQEARDSRPKLDWSNYESVLSVDVADKALLIDVISKIETFNPAPLDTTPLKTSIQAEAVRLVRTSFAPFYLNLL
jgi:hypothetical protein